MSLFNNTYKLLGKYPWWSLFNEFVYYSMRQLFFKEICKIFKEANSVEHSRIKIMLLRLSEFKWINWLLFPLKSSENQWFFNHFRGNKSWWIRINSLDIKSEIWLEYCFSVTKLSVSCKLKCFLIRTDLM